MQGRNSRKMVAIDPRNALRVFLGIPLESTAGNPEFLGSQHPSPNVKTFCKFEPQIWLEIITSRDAKSACFKGSRTSCREIILGIFWPKFWPEKITSRDGCFLPNSLPLPQCSWGSLRAFLQSGLKDSMHIGAGQTGSYAHVVGRMDLTGSYFFSPVGVHLLPLKSRDFKGFRRDFNRILTTQRALRPHCLAAIFDSQELTQIVS